MKRRADTGFLVWEVLVIYTIQNLKKAVYYLQDFCPADKGDKNAPLYESAGFFGRGA